MTVRPDRLQGGAECPNRSRTLDPDVGSTFPKGVPQMLLQGLFAQVCGPEPRTLRRGEARFGVLPHSGKEHFRSAELGHHSAKNPYRPGSGHHDLLLGFYVRSNVYGVYGHGQRLAQSRHA